jgi:Rnl2 family RNA ligase
VEHKTMVDHKYEFKPYLKMVNHHHETSINAFLYNNPSFMNEMFIVQEKIHGTNTQVNFYPDKPPVIGSRKRMLTGDKDNYNVKALFDDPEIKKEYELIFDVFQLYAEKFNCKITVFGEWFGPKICHGIDYGKKRRFRCFDVAINDELISQWELPILFREIYNDQFIVMHLGIMTYEDAMAFDPHFPSLYSTKGDLCEGVVIKPYFKNYIDPTTGDPFYIKLKNPEFLEKSKTKKDKPAQDKKDMNILLPYVNQARMDAVISKEEFTCKKDIPKFIALVTEDVITDFLIDNPDYEIQSYQKRVLAKVIVPFLLKLL